MRRQPAPTALTLVVTAHRVPYLAECMLSVAAQTTAGFALVCCADMRGEPGVAAVFRRHLPFVRCRTARLIRVPGGTAGRVRNAGFAAAHTPWVAYLDGDDVLRPGAILRLLIEIGQGGADIISTGMERITADGHRVPWPRSLTYRPPRWIYRIDPDTVGHPTFFNQLLAIRRALWQAHPFDEATNGEDIDFMLHQLLNGRFRKIPEALYGYRDTPGSFSKQHYPAGDVCTARYRRGYYARLFARNFRTALAGNFTDEPEPVS